MNKITFVGTAGFVPPGGILSGSRSFCAILLDDDTLIECGEGTLRNLKNLNVALTSIERVLISHVHADHIGGMPTLIWAMRVDGKKTNLEIIGMKGVEETTIMLLKALKLWDYDYGSPMKFIFKELEGGEKLNGISTCRGIHSIPSIAFRIDEGNKSICYSGDTAFCEDVVELAKGCDILIHDSITTEANLKKWPPLIKHHASPGEAGKAAKLAKVKKLVLFHWPAELEGNIAELIAMAEKEFDGEIIVATDGLTMDI